MNRRTFVKLAGTAIGAAALGIGIRNIPGVSAASPPVPLDPLTLAKYVDDLVVPPEFTPIDNPSYPDADYYGITMRQFTQKLHRDFPSDTTVWGYGAAGNDATSHFPGFTIKATKGKPVVVKYINNLPTTHLLPIDTTLFHGDLSLINNPVRVVPHLHGGFTPPQFDGHPEAWFTSDQLNAVHGTHYASMPDAAPNECIFSYPNQQQATTVWYHDHGMGITRLNVYAGLAGFYLIRDNLDTGVEGEGLNIPKGNYEIPIVIQDRMFDTSGQLLYPVQDPLPAGSEAPPVWVPEFFGNIAVVNGVVFPRLIVETRRYRFRLLNGSNARFYQLRFVNQTTKQPAPFYVIGTDGGLLPKPVKLNTIMLAPAERADIIFDFTGIPKGTEFILTNNAKAPYPSGGDLDLPEIMKFMVANDPTVPDTTTQPSGLVLPPVPRLTPTLGAPMREIVLKEKEDPITGFPVMVLLNNRLFADPVEENPKEGDTEIWQFINLTPDAHPMHMHLVQFQVYNRQFFNHPLYLQDWLAWIAAGRPASTKPVLANYLLGTPIKPPAEEMGWKDTAKAFPAQILRVIAKFDIPPGSQKLREYADPAVLGTSGDNYQYVYHCHILEHEDNEMMRPYDVVPK
ncbi:MAG: multicopper oxidase [Candidatus Methanoperedens sp.]|nr:multicopper oxidase [Candidatus Methanoperedens sp.]